TAVTAPDAGVGGSTTPSLETGSRRRAQRVTAALQTRPVLASRTWDDGLTDAQLEVATHGDEPLVVVAGAGTGKTRTLIARLAHLLSRGTAPERILLLTFTRRAADDMLARASAHVAGAGTLPYGGTFHAVAYRFLSARAESLGLAPGFAILDPSESVDLMDLLRADHALAGVSERFPRASTLAEIHSRCVNRGQPLREVVPVEYPWCAPHVEAMASLFRSYSARKRDAGVLDFDDLLLHWRAVLDADAADSGRSFDYVLVDEYQDVNAIQVDIVRLLAPQGRGLTVVGDEAQSIYGFRGSDSRHLRELILEWPDARVVRLETNFRSRQPILDVANAVRPLDAGPPVHLSAARGAGVRPRLLHCHDAPSEARAVVDAILDAHEEGVALREQAVLVRAGHHSDLIELELSARRVPYRKYGGLRFIDAAHVRDFVAAARLLDSPRDEVAWYRVLRLHPGIGTARARALLEVLREDRRDFVDAWPDLVVHVIAAARDALASTLASLRDARTHLLADARAGAVLEALRPLVIAQYVDAPARLGDLERLVAAASTRSNLSGWLAEITLDPAASTSDLAGPPHLDEDFVVISTIHSAKGLEWLDVHVPHVIDGVIPIDMALGSSDGLDEERRLFYVAITRARERLHLYAPMRMPHHRRAQDDRHSYALLSRFVDEAVRSHLSVEEEAPARPAIATVGATSVVVDLGHLWDTGGPTRATG
ncbi:MAG: ATP-dependent helicase, partial [Acidimicrobiales bacterium]